VSVAFVQLGTRRANERKVERGERKRKGRGGGKGRKRGKGREKTRDAEDRDAAEGTRRGTIPEDGVYRREKG